MATSSTRMTINLPESLHKRLKYQAFMLDITMTQIMERAVEGLVEHLEANDSVVSREPRDGHNTVSPSPSVPTEQAALSHHTLDQRDENAHDVLERAIAAYLSNSPRIR